LPREETRPSRVDREKRSRETLVWMFATATVLWLATMLLEYFVFKDLVASVVSLVLCYTSACFGGLAKGVLKPWERSGESSR